MTGGTQLHVHFLLRNQHAFHKLLEASYSTYGQPSSGGRSLNKPSPLSSTNRPEHVDVNARDALGRTVLHLAASTPDASAPEYVRMLLAHPSINPNLQDYESHWTALHRALYAGNIASALLLLQRADVDCNLKDLEGYRAFDLYNSTVHGTKPELGSRIDLFTWGANRNAALGVGDGDDRVYPDQVAIERVPKVSEQDTLDVRFEPVRVNQVVMSKLHTAVVTNEFRANVRACGFGSSGRLGHANHTQYTLLPLPLSLPSTPNISLNSTSNPAINITALALGQDHTLALTSAGEVYSWGLNRFSQLGYAIDLPTAAPRHPQEEVSLVQSTPRKITAPSLKGKVVTGIAACRSASVCWSRDEVWTWGANGGQLGYDKSAHPTQLLPRKVTKVVIPVLQICITETAMACLLESHDVICIFNDSTFKINFPTQTFPSSMPTYRPPQAVRNASIRKVTASSGGEGFAALSENGELFLCTLGREGSGQQHSSGRDGQVKVQRVWALRKQFSAVKDVEVGVDGSIIICTESGHVFIRSRNPNLSIPSSSTTAASLLSSTNPNSASNTKAFKFQRVPYIQRVIRVCANSLGAFGALRVDADPNALGHGRGLEVSGPTVQESFRDIRSWLAFGEDFRQQVFLGNQSNAHVHSDVHEHAERDADEEEDEAVVHDIEELKKLCEVLERHLLAQKDPSTLEASSVRLFDARSPAGWFDPSSLPNPSASAFGADVIIHVKSYRFPAHRLLLAARSDVFRAILEGGSPVEDTSKEGKIQIKHVPSSSPKSSNPKPRSNAPWHTQTHLTISGVHPLTVLILLTYLYTDELLTFWDPRVAPLIIRRLRVIGVGVEPLQVRSELRRIVGMLGLDEALVRALEGHTKRRVESSIAGRLVNVQLQHESKTKTLAPDVVLMLSDMQVPCHSTVLRARSPFFRAFFDDEDWTRERWTEHGTIKVDLRHLEWKVGRFIVWYLYGGDVEMFERLDSVGSVDELMEFMFDVMAAANELLLDRLVLICSSVILKRVTVTNACSILAEASQFDAVPLIRQLQRYISINLETLLEVHMLDDLPIDLVKQLSTFIRTEQEIKSPVSRSGVLTNNALEANKAWLALQDIPTPIVRTSTSRIEGRNAAKLSPSGLGRKGGRSGSALVTSPPPSPAVRPQIEARQSQVAAATNDGEMFMMDDNVPALALDQAQASQAPKGGAGWKVPSAPKADMKSIIAEAETSKRPIVRSTASPGKSETMNWRAPQTQRPRPEDSPALPRSVSGGSPWKLPLSGAIPIQQTPPTTPTMRPVRSKEDFVPGLKSPQADVRREPPSTPPRLPGMGPVFIPKKTNSPSKNTPSPGFRRVSSGAAGSGSAAWTLPPVQPIVQPSPSQSTSAARMSFAAIQELQREQDSAPAKDKRSLKEIQAEEREKQVEADFLKWWTAEEERMRMEQVVASSEQQQQRPKAQKERGRGRGGKGPGPASASGSGGKKVEHAGGDAVVASQPSRHGGGQRRKGKQGPRGEKEGGKQPMPQPV